MQYVLLIYTPEPTEEVPQEVLADQMAKYNAVNEHMRDRRALIAGEALGLDHDGNDGPRR